MGLFGLFGGGSRAFAKHAARVGNRRAQAEDRWASIHALAKLKTPEAVSALLARFTYVSDPTITDQEEKEAALEAIVEAGQASVAPIREFLGKAESVSWPLKALERLVPPAAVVEALLVVLGGMHTDYERDPEKKIQVVSYLADRKDPRIPEAVVRFLEDMNETVRFQAVAALFAQDLPAPEGDGGARASLLDLFAREESVRIRAAVADGFGARGWSFGERAEDLRSRLPGGYAVDGQGVPRRGA